MALISDLETHMTIDNSQFLRGIRQSTESVAGFVNGVKRIAQTLVVFEALKTGVEAVVDIISQGTEKITQLAEAAKRISVGVGPLQELQYAAEQSGISTDVLNRSLLLMEKNLGNGTKSTTDALSKLNLNIIGLKSLSPDKMFIAISNAIGGLKDPTDQASAAAALFGRNGIQLLSLFKRNVSDLTGEFKSFGGELTGEQADSVKAYAESVNRLSTIWEAFKLQLVSAISGPFKQVLDWITATIVKMGGIGEVAKSFAKAIISAAQITIAEFAGILNITDSVIINLEKMIKLVLQVGEFGTLGLSKLFSNSDQWIDNLTKDIDKRQQTANSRTSITSRLSDGLIGLNNQIGQTQQQNENSQKVDVTVKADEGLTVSIAESAAIRVKVFRLMSDYLANSASSVGQ